MSRFSGAGAMGLPAAPLSSQNAPLENYQMASPLGSNIPYSQGADPSLNMYSPLPTSAPDPYASLSSQATSTGNPAQTMSVNPAMPDSAMGIPGYAAGVTPAAPDPAMGYPGYTLAAPNPATGYPGYTPAAPNPATGYPGYTPAAPNSSTGYPGYPGYTPAAPDPSTGYPGYTPAAPNPSTGYPGYTPATNAGGFDPLASYPPPSPTYTDPYAPGGAFATPTLPAVAKTYSPDATTFAKGTHKPVHLPPFKLASPPAKIPKWIKWLSIVALVAIIGGVLYRMLKPRHIQPPPPPKPCPPQVACPPRPPVSCPPTPPCPKSEQVVLHVDKGTSPLVVELRESRQHHRNKHDNCHCDDGGRGTEGGSSTELENSTSTGNKSRTGANNNEKSQPIVIVNEMPSDTKKMDSATLPDLWGLTYAGHGGTALPRVSDTNMVYTQVGGAF